MPTYFIGYKAPLTEFDKCVREPYRLIPLEQRHLTLLYFGFLKKHEIEVLIKKVKSVKAERVTVSFNSLTALPSLQKPKYLAAIPDYKGRNRLVKIRESVEGLFADFTKEKYEIFNPHVSIAYTRSKPTIKLQKKASKSIKNCKRVKETLVFDRLLVFRAERGKITVIV